MSSSSDQRNVVSSLTANRPIRADLRKAFALVQPQFSSQPTQRGDSMPQPILSVKQLAHGRFDRVLPLVEQRILLAAICKSRRLLPDYRSPKPAAIFAVPG